MALLRGINVGGRNKLPMKDLVAIFEAAGCTDVRTYIQSGNVVFYAPEENLASLPKRLALAISERFGHAPVAVIVSAAELRTMVDGNPFLARGMEAERVHLFVLADAPTAERIATLDPDRSPGDTFEVHGRALYLHITTSLADTKLTNNYFDTKLATTSTGRNWRTVLALAEMARA